MTSLTPKYQCRARRPTTAARTRARRRGATERVDVASGGQGAAAAAQAVGRCRGGARRVRRQSRRDQRGPAAVLLFGALAGVGCALAYGMDPSKDKGLAPELARKAGFSTEQVIEALTEAEGKLREIEQLAGSLHNRELTARLNRIVAQGRAVLAQIEKDPSDLRRARRFLVTYLDGTRDVVRKYQAQQGDLADTRARRELPPRARHDRAGVRRAGRRAQAQRDDGPRSSDRGPADATGARRSGLNKGNRTRARRHRGGSAMTSLTPETSAAPRRPRRRACPRSLRRCSRACPPRSWRRASRRSRAS